MEDCLFCKIIVGTMPAEKIYEDDDVLAFLDIHPINRGHTVLVPKKHAENIYTMTKNGFSVLMGAAHTLAPFIKNAVGADGINIGMNNDRAAGQVVFHAHVHIIPRFNNDGFKHWYGTPYKEGEMHALGETLRKTKKT